MRHGRLSSPPLGCLASPYGISHAGNAIFWLNRKKRAANSGPCCHSMIWSQRLSIYSPADNSRPKNWRTLSASGTIYAERPRNHTPDGLKWRVNESDKIEVVVSPLSLSIFCSNSSIRFSCHASNSNNTSTSGVRSSLLIFGNCGLSKSMRLF